MERREERLKYRFQERRAEVFKVLYIAEACMYGFEACKKRFCLFHPFCSYLSAGRSRLADF